MPTLLLWPALLLSTAWAAPAAARPAADAAEAARLVVQQANALRRTHGLSPLQPQPDLAEAARAFARFMARTGRYGHEADGRSPAQRADEHGYAYCLLSENIAFQQRSSGFTAPALAGALLDGWRQSPGHRENLLDPDVTHTGAGVARSDSGRYYAVQMFGRPGDRAIRFRIANRSGTPLHYELDGQRHALPSGTTVSHEVCRKPEVALQWPGRSGPVVLRPRDGGQYALERGDDGTLRLSRAGSGRAAEAAGEGGPPRAPDRP